MKARPPRAVKEIYMGYMRDNGGRRSGIERRKMNGEWNLPERRSGEDRRSGKDRRKKRYVLDERNPAQDLLDLLKR